MQKFTACLLLFSLLACNSPKQEPSLKLYVLDGGRINVLNARAFSETDVYAGQSFLFANPIFVIEHSKGRLIWDLGLPEAIAGMPGGMYTPDSIFHLTENGAKLIIQHNMEDYESLPKIPAYLD